MNRKVTRALGLSFQAVLRRIVFSASILSVMFVAHRGEANLWVPLANPVLPGPSIIVPTPKEVPGKDFSDVRDRDAPGAPDVEQVVAWDGFGGVRDSLDYSGSRLAYPRVAQDIEVDGIAAGGDALFQALRDNQAALIFSVETDPRIMFSRATGFPAAPAGSGVWATPADIDAMLNPFDTDGVELWGGDQFDDSDRYSLAGDPFIDVGPALRKVSVWSYTTPLGPSNPHTFTSDLAEAIDLQLTGIGINGPLYGFLSEFMDVDAIMTFGPQVTFSIRPIQVPGTPFSFDGGEIFEYDGPGLPTRFLNHGGLTFNTALDVMGTFAVPHENIDALEAVATFVPEPSSMALLLIGLFAIPRRTRRP